MIVPVRDNLYIIPILPPVETRGLLVPETAKRRPTQGIVKYRGPWTRGDTRVGDHVFFSGWAGSQVNYESEGLIFIMEEDSVDGKMDDKPGVRWIPKPTLDNIIADAVHKMELTRKSSFREFLEYLKQDLDSHFEQELHF